MSLAEASAVRDYLPLLCQVLLCQMSESLGRVQTMRAVLGQAEQAPMEAAEAEELAHAAQTRLDELLAAGQQQLPGLQFQVPAARPS